MALKYSRQREMIVRFLQSRKDHPTADVVYSNVREVYPNISLGTVYRNLQLLTEIGQIQKIHVGDGAEHFDADTSLHYHFACDRCGKVIDFEMDSIDDVVEIASRKFPGKITGHKTVFYGLCETCLETETMQTTAEAVV